MLRIGGGGRRTTEGGGVFRSRSKRKGLTAIELRQNASIRKDSGKSGVSQRLRGSQFRRINEYLYTNKSDDAFNEYLKDDIMFEQYHSGYNIQKRLWPLDPLDRVIEYIRSNDKVRVIGDFGCGTAKISQLFGSKRGYKVYSFDLNCPKELACKNNITICNIKSVPLGDNTLDLAVFCLSLMGTDWPLFIAEACRVVKCKGLIIITEVTSRFRSIPMFISSIEKFDLKLTGGPTNITNYFTQFVFTKTSDENRFFGTKDVKRSKHANNKQFPNRPEKRRENIAEAETGNKAIGHTRRPSATLPPFEPSGKRFFSFKLNRIKHASRSVKYAKYKRDSENKRKCSHANAISIASDIDHTVLRPCMYKKR
ncbi:hypothetical protein FG386_002304 [Cryptosporidium ryanae]|uniref:uncharacterized protein n=1 Tax=Cryptosporidium ryanae TaxID=515981 RepID=UPI00351A6CFC|nr:hypothetical protein FG386_002304 [Cryptosporidium ryanae]